MSPDDFRAFSAASALLYIGGVEVGWAQDINVSETISKLPVMKLGDVHVQRFETTAVSVTGNFGYIHIMQLPLSAQASVDSGTGVPSTLWPNPSLAGLNTSSAASDYYVKFPELHVAMVDKFSQTKMIQVYGVNPTSRNFTLQNGSILGVQVGFVARRLVERPVPNAGIYR